jgi:hypothetical protein
MAFTRKKIRVQVQKEHTILSAKYLIQLRDLMDVKKTIDSLSYLYVYYDCIYFHFEGDDQFRLYGIRDETNKEFLARVKGKDPDYLLTITPKGIY